MLGEYIIHAVKLRQRSKVQIEEGSSINTDQVENPHLGFVRTTSIGDTILLILALCFHSVFEGIAVGVSG